MKYAMLLVAMMTLGACLEDEDEGRPQPNCGPANCTGCCLDETCQIGIRNSACGENGGTCANCSDYGSDWFCRTTGSYVGEPGAVMTCQQYP